MKSRLTPLVFAALGSLVLLAGCETAPVREPKTTKTIYLHPDRPSPDVEMGLVSAVRVVLPGPEPGSGLLWEITSNNTLVLEQMGPMKVEAAAEEAGARPATTVSFYALKPGRSVLRFYLLDPTLAEAVPAATCELTVRVID